MKRKNKTDYWITSAAPPLRHRLVYLAEKSELDLNDHFSLEARYPDEKFSFYKRSCTNYPRAEAGVCNKRNKELKYMVVTKKIVQTESI